MVAPGAALAQLGRAMSKATADAEARVTALERSARESAELADLVSVLPERTTHRIMVPFGAAAFFEGALVHTNELTCHLGVDVYAERSAAQAAALLRRRGDAASAAAAEARSALERVGDRLLQAQALLSERSARVAALEARSEALAAEAATASAAARRTNGELELTRAELTEAHYRLGSTAREADSLRKAAATAPEPATPASVVAEVMRLRAALDRAEGEAARARASALESSATAAAVLQQAEDMLGSGAGAPASLANGFHPAPRFGAAAASRSPAAAPASAASAAVAAESARRTREATELQLATARAEELRAAAAAAAAEARGGRAPPASRAEPARQPQRSLAEPSASYPSASGDELERQIRALEQQNAALASSLAKPRAPAVAAVPLLQPWQLQPPVSAASAWVTPVQRPRVPPSSSAAGMMTPAATAATSTPFNSGLYGVAGALARAAPQQPYYRSGALPVYGGGGGM